MEISLEDCGSNQKCSRRILENKPKSKLYSATFNIETMMLHEDLEELDEE